MTTLLQRTSGRIYSALLRLYPATYRARFGAPMQRDFADLCREHVRGPLSALPVWWREFPSLVRQGLAERLAPGGRRPGSLPFPRSSTMNASWLSTVRQDTAHALRMLRRRPVFTAVVIVTLALGIGMNTAIFSVLHGVLLEPLPFPEPERLVRFGRQSPESQWLNPVSPREFRDVAARLETLASAAAATPTSAVLTGDDNPVLVHGATTTVGLFDTFGVQPFRGRFLEEADAAAGAEPVVVISHSFWRDRMGGAEALGTPLLLDGTAHRIVGIAPPGFDVRPTVDLHGAEFWLPLVWTERALTVRHSHYVMPYGRLAADATVQAASEEMDASWRDYLADDPGNHLDPAYEIGLRAAALHEFTVRGTQRSLAFLAGAVALVLAIACVNVANLLLANVDARRHELAVRAALGAGRGRLARQFLTESLLLAAIGGTLGVVVAMYAVRALLGLYPDAVPRAAEIGVDLPVLAFAAVVSLATALVLGTVPALQIETGAAALRDHGGQSTRASGLRQATVVAEIALALVLVIGAGLMLQSFWNARTVDLGFEPEGLLVANFSLGADDFADDEARAQFYDRLLERLRSSPGVEGAAVASMVPVRDFGNNFSNVYALGDPDRRARYVEWRQVSTGYHQTLGVALLQGRDFTATDFEVPIVSTPLIINAELARILFDEADPVGRQLMLGLDDDTPHEVVGVLANIRAGGAERELRPVMYAPTRAADNVLVRHRGEAAGSIEPLTGVAAEIDGRARLYRAETYDTLIADSLGDRSFMMLLVGAFGAVALTLGAVGTYGVIAYAIEGRMRDFGIRMALGARSLHIRWQVLRGGGKLALVGTGIGLAGAWALRALVGSLLYDAEAASTVVFLGATATMLTIALLACWIPASRAASSDPAATLRDD